jgi:hypothetical protein
VTTQLQFIIIIIIIIIIKTHAVGGDGNDEATSRSAKARKVLYLGPRFTALDWCHVCINMLITCVHTGL